MRSIGIDLGKVNSQMSVRDASGEEVTNVRFATTRERLNELLSGEKARILVEAGTPTRWVARHLGEMGHEVTVADPNYLPMYVDKKSKRKKTDKRDASLLSRALFEGNFRTAHLRSDEQQANKMRLDLRSRLVETRTKHISAVRATFAQSGATLKKPQSSKFVPMAREAAKELSEEHRTLVEVELEAIEFVTKKIDALDDAIEARARTQPQVRQATTHPGVGGVTAAVFVATLDDPKRFGTGREVASFIGLAPAEMSSGERRLMGRITKAGPAYLRHLLVQAAWAVWRSKSEESANLRAWMERLAARRGRSIAVVAMARKIAVTLWAMWRDGQPFKPNHLPDRSGAA